MVGVYGGMKIPSVLAYINGFREGIAYFNTFVSKTKKVKYDNGGFVGNFAAGGKSQTTAEKLVNDGSEILLAVGGPQYKDAINAVKTRSNAKAIGVDVVTGGDNGVASKDKRYIFGSILKNLRKVTKK